MKSYLILLVLTVFNLTVFAQNNSDSLVNKSFDVSSKISNDLTYIKINKFDVIDYTKLNLSTDSINQSKIVDYTKDSLTRFNNIKYNSQNFDNLNINSTNELRYKSIDVTTIDNNYNFMTEYRKTQFKKIYLPIILFTTSIVFNAVGDGLNINGTRRLGHVYNAASIATLLAIPLTCDLNKRQWYTYILSYTFIRVGLFDPIINKTRHLPLNYAGNESYTDMFWQKNPSDLFTRTWFFTMGVVIPIKVLHEYN